MPNSAVIPQVLTSAEIKRLSSELNSRKSREMDEMLNSVSVQTQRANNDANSSEVLPQIQMVLMAGSGHMTQKGLNVPGEGPEIDPNFCVAKILGTT